MKARMMTLLGLVLIGSICSAEVVWEEDFESKPAYRSCWGEPAGWSLVEADIQGRKSTVLDIKGGGENLTARIFPFQDFDYEADFRIVNGYGGFIFRAQDGGDLYMIQFGGGNAYFCPHTMKNGSYRFSRVPLASAISLGQWRHIKFEIRGQNIKCYLGKNPEQMELAGDWTGKETYSGGRLGFRCVGAEHMQVGNIRVSTSEPVTAKLQLSRSAPPRMIFPGHPFDMKVNIHNVGWKAARNIRAALFLPEGFKIIESKPVLTSKKLKPGSSHSFSWKVQAVRPTEGKINIDIQYDGLARAKTITANCIVNNPLPLPPASAPDKAVAQVDERKNLVLGNQNVRLVFINNDKGYSGVVISVHDGKKWRQVAVSQPLGHFAYRTGSGQVIESDILPTEYEIIANTGRMAQLRLKGKEVDPEGAGWQYSFTYKIDSGIDRVYSDYRIVADRDRELVYFQGPDLYAGEGSFGARKDQALFGGMEYLEEDERSSSDRDMVPAIANRYVPHPYKVAMPVMAVAADKCLVGLMWDQLQKWDGEHFTVSARFASPNWKDEQENHLMGLFLPSKPNYVPENQDRAAKPYPLRANREISLKAWIVADYEAELVDVVDHYLAVFEPLKKMTLSENYDEILEKCRVGYMQTMWDPKVVGTKHWDGGPAQQFPNACAILWSDAIWTQDPAVKKRQKERVQLIVNKALETKGVAGLVDPIDTRAFGTLPCHIRGYFLPLYIGHLEGGLANWKERIYKECLNTQNVDGSWPVTGAESCLQGDEIVSGTVAELAGSVLMYARVTGDERALQAGLKALKFLDNLAVPRGAQVWEVPKYTPDILASGHALWAYLEGYQITGNPHYLARAKYWAKTALPFVYHWQAPDVKLMKYCTIPVYGTTFYTGAWFGRPVQWCGLVPAYWLIRLSQFDQSFPWKAVGQGIVDNGIQQMLNLWKTHPGTYTDSLGMIDAVVSDCKFEPESLMKPIFLMRGHGVEVNSRVLRTGSSRVHVSTGAILKSAELAKRGRSVTFEVKYPEGETSYAVVAGLSPNFTVEKSGSGLSQTTDLNSVTEGWDYTQDKLLLLKLQHDESVVELTVTP